MKDNNQESIPKAYEELTVAFYQQDIAWENPEANYQLVEKAFAELKNSADVLIVPETFNTGFSDNMAAMAEPPEGPTFQFALRMAKQHNALLRQRPHLPRQHRGKSTGARTASLSF